MSSTYASSETTPIYKFWFRKRDERITYFGRRKISSVDLSDTSKNVIRELNNLKIGLAHAKFGFRQKQELMEKSAW